MVSYVWRVRGLLNINMSNTTLKSHFAKMCGVSQMAIGKACRVGNIKTCIVNGKEVVNLDHRITKAYLASKTGSTKPPKAENKPKFAKVKKVAPVDEPEETKEKTSDKWGKPRSLGEITNENVMDVDKQDMDKLDKYESALTKQQKREAERNVLIKRDLVETVFAKIYSVDTNELKELENRLSPAICGIFKANDDGDESIEVRKLMNKEITKSLRHIKRIMDTFLKRHKVKDD